MKEGFAVARASGCFVLWIALTGIAAAGAPSIEPGMPPEILSWRDAVLSRPRYQELANEWRTYVDAHPRSAVAHVQLARALRYAGSASQEERNALIRKAYEIDPECPEALDAIADTGLHSGSPLADIEEAVDYSRRAIRLAPQWTYPRFTLWSLLVVERRFDEARDELRAIRAAGGFPSPLLDFNYNLLMSAEPGAIVFTNGDNDTYPALALQAAFGTREDVAVVNLSLLNHIEYARSVWEQTYADHAPFTEKEISALQDGWKSKDELRTSGKTFSTVVVQALMDKVRRGDWSRPVYFALTVVPSHLEACGQRFEIEGTLLRVKDRRPEGEECCEHTLALDRTLQLFRKVFRLESATDLAYAWGPESAIRPLMTNYAAVLQRAADGSAKRQDLEAVRYCMRTAIDIVEFHEKTDLVREMATYWKEIDPKNTAIDRWLSR